jgi:hypothetical protein
MWPFKKKAKPLNNAILLRWRHEALGRLTFVGGWSGYWETCVGGIRYRGERVSGLKAVLGDTGTFIQDALIDRVKLEKKPSKYSEEIAICK